MSQHASHPDDRIYFVPTIFALGWSALVVGLAGSYFNLAATTFNIIMVAAWMIIPNLIAVPVLLRGERWRLRG